MVKSVFLEGRSAAKVHRILMKMLDKEALSESTVCEWCLKD